MAYYAMKDYRLHDVISAISTGRLQLPEFQRNYVWKPNEQKSLLDSIQKGYPVGALLLLEVDSANGEKSSPFGKRPFEDAPNPTESLKELVLDGQQRLTTCYKTFSGRAKDWFFLDLRKLFELTKGEAGRQIDLTEFLIKKPKPKHPELSLFESNLLPLPYVTEDRNELRQNLNGFANNLSKIKSEQAFSDFVKVTLHGYLDAFYDYKFPAIVLPAKLDLEAVSNVFTKLNTTGMKLSAFDLCVSRLFPEKINLRQMWSEVKDDPGIRLLDSDGTAILQTVTLLDAKPAKKAALVNNVSKESINEYWSPSVAGLKEATKHLNHIGVQNSQTLPYDTLAPSLAAALVKAKPITSVPEQASRQHKVARWVIQTAFTQRYTEGTDAKKTEDFDGAVKWFDSNALPQFLLEQVVWQPSNNLAKASGARYAALLAILNTLAPLDFILGKPLGLGIPSVDPAQLHHIFPRAYLINKKKTRDEINVLLNMTFLSMESNIFISDKAPSIYVRELLAGFVKEGLSDRLAKQKLVDMFRSHLISEDAINAMLDDDYERFLDARAVALLGHLEALGVPVSKVSEDSAGELETGQGEEDVI